MPRWRIVVTAAVLVLAWPALVEAQKPPDKPPPATHGGGGAKPPSQPKDKPAAKPGWVARADSVCRDGSRQRDAIIDAVRRKPSPSVRQALLRILSGTVGVERGMIVRLEKVRVASPAGARSTVALRLFRERWAGDATLVKRLRRRWDAGLLERQTRLDRGANAQLVILWSDLGSTGCATYFRSLNGN